MNAFNNFLRLATSKEEKAILLKEARELQAKSPDRAENATVGIYTTATFEYAPNKEAKLRGFAGLAVPVVGPCRSKVELSVATALPDGVVVLVEIKSASEMRFELKLIDPSTAAFVKITDCKTAVTVHTVPCLVAELIELLVEQTTPPPTPPQQHTPLAWVPGHRILPRSRPTMQPSVASSGRPQSHCSRATMCFAAVVAMCLLTSSFSLKVEPRLSKVELAEPARSESVCPGRACDEVIARLALGDPVPEGLLPLGLTEEDVTRFVIGLSNQVFTDVIVVLKPCCWLHNLLRAQRVREVIREDGLHERFPPEVIKELPYVGETLAEDLDHLNVLVSDLVRRFGPPTTANHFYEKYAHIKQLCAWFAQRWEGACERHLSA